MVRVVALFVSRSGTRMQACTAVQALAGQGLQGDRYALGEGTYSRSPRPAARHVSLIERKAMDIANQELIAQGLAPFEAHETRRNIVVEGIDVYTLLDREFRIGTVRLRGSDITGPCHVPSAAAGKTGFKEAFHNRGGILAEIMTDGVISIGDMLVVEPLPT
ncbi:MAG TPA: MOSC domain-containing protein [Xanthobacteraceae bacterium]|nr:MOSC domain-containing protein [Xanthobacteraceae bacterium]